MTTSCEKQANQQGLGWVSTGVVLLFAFLITLPFAGQSIASTGHSHAGMEIDIVASERHEVSKKLATRNSQNSKMCEASGHVEHGAHSCCFDNINVARSSLRRDVPVIQKPVLVASSHAFIWLAENVARIDFAPEFSSLLTQASQTIGLAGAAADFLRTQRLLT